MTAYSTNMKRSKEQFNEIRHKQAHDDFRASRAEMGLSVELEKWGYKLKKDERQNIRVSKA